MRKWHFPCVMILSVMLAGCDAQHLMNSFIPSEEEQTGQLYLDDIRAGNFGPVQNQMDPAYRDQLTMSVLQEMRSAFPREPLTSVKVVGSNTASAPESKTYALTYEYEFRGKWLLSQIVLRKIGGRTQIEGMHVVRLADSLEHLNAATLTGKGAIHYLFLVLAVSTLLLTLGTAVVCFRTPILRRKWLWVIFVLVGFGSFTLNWTTGAVNFQPFQVLLFATGFIKQFYGPLMLQLSFPIGALVFWFRRGKWPSDHYSVRNDIRNVASPTLPTNDSLTGG